MKTHSPIPYLLAATLFTSPAFLRAETKPAGAKPAEKIDQGAVWKPGDNNATPPGYGEVANRNELLKRFDKNGDGKLDQDERAAALKAYMADHPELMPRGN